MVTKKGFTLIELVISIVVISIAVMSIPMLLERAGKSDEFSLMQESILAARTKIQNITTYRWDENSLDPVTGKIYILDTHNGDSELQRFTASSCPPLPFGFLCMMFWSWYSSFFPQGGLVGQIDGDSRRKMFDVATYPDITEVNITDPNDVDDFNGQSLTALFDQESTGLDYLNSNFNINTTVGYIDDTASYKTPKTIYFNFPDTFKPVGDSNIKMVDVNVSGVDTPFALRYYSCNIGESDILKRTFL